MFQGMTLTKENMKKVRNETDEGIRDNLKKLVQSRLKVETYSCNRMINSSLKMKFFLDS